jgi:hypothetical protein
VTVCRVITYAPGRASFPKPQFQSYPTPGGILTLVPSQCRPSKISVKANTKFQADLSVSSEFISSRLQGDTLRAIFLDLSIRPSFLSRHAGRVPCGLWFLFSASESPFLAMLLLHVPSFLGRHAGRAPCGPCSSCLDYSVRLWVTNLDSLSLSLRLRIYTDTTSSLPRQESTF